MAITPVGFVGGACIKYKATADELKEFQKKYDAHKVELLAAIAGLNKDSGKVDEKKEVLDPTAAAREGDKNETASAAQEEGNKNETAAAAATAQEEGDKNETAAAAATAQEEGDKNETAAATAQEEAEKSAKATK